MNVIGRRRSWWGWGWEDEAVSGQDLANIGAAISRRPGFGALAGSITEPRRPEDLHLRVPRIAPPAAPDVGAQDLLVQGGPQPSAVAALRFTVPDGAEAGPLVLPLAAGSAARAELVVACPATKAWQPVLNGPWSAVPTWSCQRSAPAALSDDGLTLVVADIARLVAEDGTLSIVLVPGSSDRVVLQPPPLTALTVTPRPARAEPAPVVAPAPRASEPPPVAEPPPFPATVGPAPAPLAPARFVVLALPAPPVVLAGGTGTGAGSNAPRLQAAGGQGDGRTRALLAAEAVLVLVFFGLLGTGPLGRLALLTGQPVVDPARPRGIGRFTTSRTGPAPRL